MSEAGSPDPGERSGSGSIDGGEVAVAELADSAPQRPAPAVCHETVMQEDDGWGAAPGELPARAPEGAAGAGISVDRHLVTYAVEADAGQDPAALPAPADPDGGRRSLLIVLTVAVAAIAGTTFYIRFLSA